MPAGLDIARLPPDSYQQTREAIPEKISRTCTLPPIGGAVQFDARGDIDTTHQCPLRNCHNTTYDNDTNIDNDAAADAAS
jgi:hypothetical protein